MQSEPRPVPEAVRRLWETIEDYFERTTGKRKPPVRKMARKTKIASSTISDWFLGKSFPTWERFSPLLSYFDDPVFRQDLAILWTAAWQEHQETRGKPAPESAVPAGSAATRPRARRFWIPAGVTALLLLVAVIGTAASGRVPPTETTAPRPAIQPRILQPADSALIDYCTTVIGTAPPLGGQATYWLLVKSTNSLWLGPKISPAPDGSWTIPIRIGEPGSRDTVQLLLVRADAVLTGEWVAHAYQKPKPSPITMPSTGMARLASVQVRRGPQPGNCPTPTPSARLTPR